MEPSSSFVQLHEFLDVFLQQFPFEQKAKHHVEECSGKVIRRRTCDSEAEVGMFGVKKPAERKANLFVKFGCFRRPGESRVGLDVCFRECRETCARQGPVPSNEFSRVEKDDFPFLGTRKLVRSGVCERAGSTRRGWTATAGNFPTNVYLEKVFKTLRQTLNLPEDAQVLNEQTNVLIWGLFMSTMMKASVHLGPSYNDKLWSRAETPISKSSRRCSTSRRDSSWNMHSRF